MSDFFKDFVKEYNKLAKINDKPLIKVAGNEEDLYEEYEPSEQDADEAYMPPEEKPMKMVELKSIYLNINDALDAVRRLRADPSIDKSFSNFTFKIWDHLLKAQAVLSKFPGIAEALKGIGENNETV